MATMEEQTQSEQIVATSYGQLVGEIERAMAAMEEELSLSEQWQLSV